MFGEFKSSAVDKIIALKITLNDTKPAIWRKVQVPSDVTFFDLHHIIQISMGWTNSHLFEFQVGDYKLGYVSHDLHDMEDTADAGAVLLDLLLLKKGLQFGYLYDFGDYWQHTVVVERLINIKKGVIYPVCTDGQMACPREDSGGISGHYENLKIIKDPKHPEYKDTKRWVGRAYDPEKFDIDKVNKELPKFKKWMRHWE